MKRVVIAGLACIVISVSAQAQRGERSIEERPSQVPSFDRSFDSRGTTPSRSLGRGYSGGSMADDPMLDQDMRGGRQTRTRSTRSSRSEAAVPAGLCGAARPLATLAPMAALRLAWCLMEADRPLQAVPAFTLVIERGDARMRQEAAYGRTLAYLRKDLTAEAAVAAADAPQSRQRNAELGSNILEQRALAAFRDGRYTETVMHLDDRTRFAPDQTDLMLLRAYALLRLGRSADAERIFRAVERSGNPDGAAGVNALQEALGLVRSE